jgi:hypothetical protein
MFFSLDVMMEAYVAGASPTIGRRVMVGSAMELGGLVTKA